MELAGKETRIHIGRQGLTQADMDSDREEFRQAGKQQAEREMDSHRQTGRDSCRQRFTQADMDSVREGFRQAGRQRFTQADGDSGREGF